MLQSKWTIAQLGITELGEEVISSFTQTSSKKTQSEKKLHIFSELLGKETCCLISEMCHNIFFIWISESAAGDQACGRDEKTIYVLLFFFLWIPPGWIQDEGQNVETFQ